MKLEFTSMWHLRGKSTKITIAENVGGFRSKRNARNFHRCFSGLVISIHVLYSSSVDDDRDHMGRDSPTERCLGGTSFGANQGSTVIKLHRPRTFCGERSRASGPTQPTDSASYNTSSRFSELFVTGPRIPRGSAHPLRALGICAVSLATGNW